MKRTRIKDAAGNWLFLLCAAVTLASIPSARPVAAAGAPSSDLVAGRILITGAGLHGANGIQFGEDGRLYAASVVGREIVRLHPGTGRFLDRWGPEVGVNGPDDLAFGFDGRLYFTELLGGEVGALLDGQAAGRQFVAPGMNPVTVSDEGRLFAGQFIFGNGLFELDPDLEADPEAVIPDAGDPSRDLNAMDFGPDGLLYVPQPRLGRVIRLDVDLGFSSIEEVVAGLDFPVAAKFDASGALHVAEQTTGRVWRVDVETGEKQPVARLAPGVDNLAFDAADRLFVSSTWNGSIRRVRPNGSSARVIRGGAIAPGGIAVTRDERGREILAVADVFGLRTYRASTGRRTGTVRTPATHLTASWDGESIWTTSWFSNTVERIDPKSGAVLETHADFAVPLNAVRFGDDLIVAEAGVPGQVPPRIVRRRPDGTREVLLAANGTSVFLPLGIAASDDGLWTADWGSGVVWELGREGAYVPPVAVASGLRGPEGIAVLDERTLVAVEGAARTLTSVDLDTGTATVLVEDLEVGAPGIPGTPPSWIFNDVAVDRRGRMYVTGGNANVVYRFRFREQ